MRLEVRDLDGDEPARERQVHVPGLISLRRVDGGEDELELGRQPHEVPGPDEFMELRLDEGVGPVEFIEEGGFGLPDGQGGGDELEGPFRQSFRVEEPHQVVEVEGRDFVVAKRACQRPRLPGQSFSTLRSCWCQCPQSARPGGQQRWLQVPTVQQRPTRKSQVRRITLARSLLLK